MAPECDLRRRADLAQLGFGIVRDHRIRVLKERRDRLRWPAAYKSGQGLNVVRPRRIKLWREAPRKDALDRHLRHAAQRFRRHLPAFDHRLDEGISFRPRAVQRKRFHLVGIFGGEPHACGASQRQAEDVRARNSGRPHKGGDIVGE